MMGSIRRRGIVAIVVCAGTLASAFCPSATRAKTVPDFKIGAITIKPYATDQLDAGGFFDSQPSQPGAAAHGSRIRNGFRVNIADQVEGGVIWDFGPAPGGPMRLFEGRLSYTGLKHFMLTAGVFKP